jgi:hypothetical protein
MKNYKYTGIMDRNISQQLQVAFSWFLDLLQRLNRTEQLMGASESSWKPA